MTLSPNDPRVQEVQEAYRRGDLQKEISLLKSLLAEYPNEVALLQRLAAAEMQRGKTEDAIALLERAETIEPQNRDVLNLLGFIHDKSGNRDRAKYYFETLIANNQNDVEARVNLGSIHLAEGDIDGARVHFEKALQLKDDYVPGIVQLASLCEREHRLEEARSLAERAVKISPSHGRANTVLALVELRMDRAEEAVSRLEHIISTQRMNDMQKATAHYILGQGRDKLGDYGKAFTACKTANDIFHQRYKRSFESMDSALAPASLSKVEAFFAAEKISSWTRPARMKGSDPVFFLGFPRSGTTLLDQILKAHSAVTSLEEKDTLADVRDELVRPSGALDTLKRMTDDEINRYREKYWARVREELKTETAGDLIIDKKPLNTTFLGLIYRLFPNARILFALRDPRDVVLSCFQQRFGVNTAMFQFLKLETTAAYYDQVMSIGETCRAKMPLQLHVVRYEDMVADMRQTVADVLAFLDLEWEDGVLDYREHAQKRWISTPSAQQVIKPINASAVGKWRNYRRYLEPVLPTLEPWVEKFGYEPS